MLHRIYWLSPRARLVGSTLVCEYPLQQVQLNPSAAQLLAALKPDVPLHELAEAATMEAVDWLEHKVTQGALRVRYTVTPPRDLPPVEVVIPVLGNAGGLARCLDALGRVNYSPQRLRVTVVDDGSVPAVRDALPAAPPSGLTLRWLRLERNAGPASARNLALETPWPDEAPAHDDLCAFVDSDCVPDPGWLSTLAGVLEGEPLAAVGGGVRGLHHYSLLARYEAECSSLHLGGAGGGAGLPTLRYPYLPSCNLVVRRAELVAIGGFRAGLRLGEDVDLSWRLTAAGRRLFYYPGGAVAHAYRQRLGPFLARKRAYARSEAWLRRTHPGHFPRAGLRGLRAAMLVAAVASIAHAGWGAGALALGALAEGGIRWLHQPARQLGIPLRARLAAAARRAAAGLTLVCRGALRATLVLWLPAVAAVPRLAPAFALMVALGSWAEWQGRRPALPPHEFALGFLLDALGYSAGRLEGMAQDRFGRRGTGPG